MTDVKMILNWWFMIQRLASEGPYYLYKVVVVDA